MNRTLERTIASSLGLLDEEMLELATPDRSVPVADNFLYTRGNFEQHSFSANVFESLRDALEASLTDELREQDSLAWAEIQNRLGNILGAIGQQQHDPEIFKKAIECFMLALEEYKQEDSPLEWAATQANLATALQALGRLESDAKALNKAVDAYTAALLVYTKKETPEEWKLIMLQLGMTFHTYGILLKGNRTFQKAVVAYKNAISELDADNYPVELAAAHNNCGAVLLNLAESEENPERFEEAARSYETGWKVCMEQQRPVHLSVLCRVNKATARRELAELTNDAVLAEDIADEFELIMECFPHALQPLCLKHCEEQLNQAKKIAGISAA
ncbi:MAG: tetratricopeptide repeat protein [Gammaproteobacteria bacterium]